MLPTPRTPIGRTRDRFLVILLGVVAGYVLAGWLESRFGWQGVGMLTMPLGGIAAGVLARLTMGRFRDPTANSNELRRSR